MPVARFQDILGPDAGVEDGIGMERVHANACRSPLQRGDARQLSERCFRRGVGRGAGPGRGHVFRSDDDHASAARRQFQERITFAQQRQVRIEIDGKHAPPFLGVERFDRRTGWKNSRIQDQHVETAETTNRFLQRIGDRFLGSHIAASKAALTQLARVAALEWGAAGIRVNTLHPNAVFDTGIWTEDVLKARDNRRAFPRA